MTFDDIITQAAFGAIVGIEQPTVSRLQADGILPTPLVLGPALLAYCGRLREMAAGRYSNGPLDLGQERAALARTQRLLAEERLAVVRGENAPIELLARTLAEASQAVAERFEQLPGQVRRRCPTLPARALDEVQAVCNAARNAWVAQTVALVSASVLSADDDDEDANAAPAVEVQP